MKEGEGKEGRKGSGTLYREANIRRAIGIIELLIL